MRYFDAATWPCGVKWLSCVVSAHLWPLVPPLSLSHLTKTSAPFRPSVPSELAGPLSGVAIPNVMVLSVTPGAAPELPLDEPPPHAARAVTKATATAPRPKLRRWLMPLLQCRISDNGS